MRPRAPSGLDACGAIPLISQNLFASFFFSRQRAKRNAEEALTVNIIIVTIKHFCSPRYFPCVPACSFGRALRQYRIAPIHVQYM